MADVTQAIPEFGLSTQQCRLLLALERSSTLSEVANHLRRDASVVSRQLKQISEIAPLVRKHGAAWRLTEMGQKFCVWTRHALEAQQLLLSETRSKRISAPPDIAERIVAPNLASLKCALKAETVSIRSETDPGSALLGGESDAAIHSGLSHNSSIREKTIADIPIVIVGSNHFLERHGVRTLLDLRPLPFLNQESSRLPPVLLRELNICRVSATFTDTPSIREAVIAGAGWAALPLYAVKREIEQGQLIPLPESRFFEKLRVFWNSTQEEPTQLIEWLKQIVKDGRAATLKTPHIGAQPPTKH